MAGFNISRPPQCVAHRANRCDRWACWVHNRAIREQPRALEARVRFPAGIPRGGMGAKHPHALLILGVRARFRPCGTARESAEEHGAMAEMGGPHHHRGRGMFRGVLVRTTRLVAIPHGSGPVCFRRLQRPHRARIRPLRERRGAGGGCFPLRSTGNCIYRKDKIARLAVAFAPKRMARER